MAQEPDEICGYMWPEDYEVGDWPDHQNCCYRSTLEDSDRCAWHAKPDCTDGKTIEAMREVRVDPEIRQQTSPVGELLDGSVLTNFKLEDEIPLNRVNLRGSDCVDANFRNTNLMNANLDSADMEGANFVATDLKNANLIGTDLKNALFHETDLTDAFLFGADLKDAYLGSADLMDLDLTNADLTDADLVGANLNNADLTESNLTGTDLRYTDLSDIDFRSGIIKDVRINASTTFGRLTRAERQANDAREWDDIARAYHSLKTTFNEAGLIGKARKHHYLERRARGYEKKASTDLNPWVTPGWLGSFISRSFIGYGVQVQTLVTWMLILFVVSTAVYVSFGVEETIIENTVYSVLAFTVAPPGVPEGLIPQVMVMIETFFGTLSIVLLGYVLGNREQF